MKLIKLKKNNILEFLYFYWENIGIRVVLVVMLSVLSSAMEMVGIMTFVPLITGETKNILEKILGEGGKLIHKDLFENNQLLIWVIILSFFLKAILAYLNSLYQYKIRLSVYHELQKKMLNSFESIKFNDYLTLSGGWLQEIFAKHVINTSEAIAQFTGLLGLTVMTITFMVSVVMLSPAILIGCIVSGLLGVVGYTYLSSKMTGYSLAEIKCEAEYVTLMQRCLTSFKYLMVTGVSEKLITHMKNEVNNLIKVKTKMHRVAAIATNFREPFILSTVMLLYYIEIKIGGGEVSEFMIVITFLYRALTSLFGISMGWLEISRFFGSINSITQHLEKFKCSAHLETKEKNIVKDKKQKIELINVSLGYPGKKDILTNINMELNGPQLVVICGESGSGKTSILNLLSGLISQTSGIVRIMGSDPSKLNSTERQNIYGYVSQETPLFDTTLENNIALWEVVDNKKMQQGLNDVGLMDVFLNEMPSNNLGRDGMSLSGGQRQRVLIARELYREAQILLLDEPTSSLDSEAELLVINILKEIAKKKMVIIITHSLLVEKYADKVYKIQKGKVSEKK